MRISAAVTASALLATFACSEPLVFDDWTIPVPDGAPIVEYAHVPLEERTDRIELVEDLVIGDGDDPNERFYQAWGLAVDARGGIYVAEYGNHRIQVFDDQGNYVRTLGSEGQGPGEMQNPMYVTVAGDVVAAIDERNGRLTRWSAVDGELLGTAQLAERSLEVFGLEDGRLVGTHVVFHREPEFSRERVSGLFSVEGEELERYSIFRLLPGGSISVPNAIDRMVVARDGIAYITRADRYQVLAFNAGGDPRWALRTTWPTPEIPEEIFERALAALRERQPDYERPDTWLGRMPAIGNITVDGDGNLYVFPYVYIYRDPYPYGESDDSPAEYAVDVYSPDGELLSNAVIDRMGWSAASGDHVYSRGLDPETDNEVIRRYRLVVPWEQ